MSFNYVCTLWAVSLWKLKGLDGVYTWYVTICTKPLNKYWNNNWFGLWYSSHIYQCWKRENEVICDNGDWIYVLHICSMHMCYIFKGLTTIIYLLVLYLLICCHSQIFLIFSFENFPFFSLHLFLSPLYTTIVCLLYGTWRPFPPLNWFYILVSRVYQCHFSYYETTVYIIDNQKLERNKKIERKTITMLPPAWIMVLLHFWVGLSLYVFPETCLMSMRQFLKTNIEGEHLEHAQTIRLAPIYLKGKPLGSHMVGWKFMFTWIPPLWLGGP